MPELPDVEVFRRRLDATSLRRRIVSVAILAPELVRDVSPRTLKARLTGRQFRSTRRHGKNLFAELSGGGALLLHFGMTGDLAYYHDGEEAPRHVRLRLDFPGGAHLAFDDQRKFGRIAYVENVETFIRNRRLGPDPLSPGFDLETFRGALRKKRGGLKAALLDQRMLAGIGNLYADEILFQSGLHPAIRIEALADRAVRALYRRTRHVLEKAVAAGVEFDRLPRTWLLRHRDTDRRCPRCGDPLARMTAGGRTTYYCSRDQRKGSANKKREER
jgi:formamidopyrimidine-DNA glycosylase